MFVPTFQPKIEGNIEFSHASFSYPSRSSVKVLRDLTYLVQPGQSIALVGPSGCGKSTCIQLLQRFYNMNGGELVSAANWASYNKSIRNNYFDKYSI